jgi:hypothetical protein
MKTSGPASSIVGQMEDAMSIPPDVNRRLSNVPVVMTLTLGRTDAAAGAAAETSPSVAGVGCREEPTGESYWIRLSAGGTSPTDD